MAWHLDALEIAAITCGALALLVLLISGIAWLRSRARSRTSSPPGSALPLNSSRAFSTLTPLSAPPLTAGTHFSYSTHVVTPWTGAGSTSNNKNVSSSRLPKPPGIRPGLAHLRRQASEGAIPPPRPRDESTRASLAPPGKNHADDKPFVSYQSGLRRLGLARAGTDVSGFQLNGTANKDGLAVSPMSLGLGMDGDYARSPLQMSSPHRRTSYRSHDSPGRLTDHLGVESYFQLDQQALNSWRTSRNPTVDRMPHTAHSSSTALPSSRLSPARTSGSFSRHTTGSLASTSTSGMRGITPGREGLRITLGTGYSELGDLEDEGKSAWLPSYYQPRLPSLRLEGVPAQEWGDEVLGTAQIAGMNGPGAAGSSRR